MRKRILHQTAAAMRFDAEQEYDYVPGDRVMTIDGIPGTVVAVNDGPFRGNEEYEISLDDGLGGGFYTSSQIRGRVNENLYTADRDYPELGEVLRKRPDPAKLRFRASREPSSTARLLLAAREDEDFRFHVMAAWKDVVAKAKRIRSEGGVNITHVGDDMVIGNVQGDTAVYETGIQHVPGRRAMASYSCGCKWGAYHWGAPDDLSRFAGRMCSHALALQYEAQSRGMFGRRVSEDSERPSWVPSRVVVKHDLNTGTDIMAHASLDPSPLSVAAELAQRENHEDTLSMLAAVNDLFGNGPGIEPTVQGSPLGATKPRNPSENPASAGPASGPDPGEWHAMQPSPMMRESTKEEEDEGVEAELKEEPEAALPGVTAKNWEYADPSALSPQMGDSNGTPTPESGGVVTSVPSPDSPEPGLEGSNTADEVMRVLNDFYRSEGAQSLMSGMSRMAMKNFSFPEQQALINEGAGKRARNFDRLDIKGTHYAYMEEEDKGEDQVWLA